MASRGGAKVAPNEKNGAPDKIQSNKFIPSSSSKTMDYRSQGVTDNDIFLLPASDFQLLGLITAIAALVRLFRIYQPSSVVFDEVQWVSLKIYI